MATFSENQVRHLYVAKGLKNPNVIATDTAGSIAVKGDTAKSSMYFQYMGAGGMTRTDLIDIKSIMQAKATDASAMARKLNRVKVTLDAGVNGGVPVGGQDYLLRIVFRQYIGLSEEDQYFKYGMVHAVTGMTASNFYKILAISLVKNFSREEEGLLKFYLETTGTKPDAAGTLIPITKETKEATLVDTYTGIVIEELPQEWVLGVKQQVPVYFTVLPGTIKSNGDERIWGVAAKLTPANIITNGTNIADLEYFLMGERGDQYRMIGFPNVVRTTYLVDPTLQYNCIDITYAYTGSNEGVQKSEKTMTIVVPKVGATNSVSNKLTNDVIGAINTASGLSIPLLGVETA